MTKTEELLNLLVQNELISSNALAEIRKQPAFNVNPEEAIISKGLVDIEELTKFKAKVYNFKYQGLLGMKISDQALNLIPLAAAENYKIVCFEVAQKAMKVGMIDPENFKAFEAIDFLAKEQDLKPEYFLISILSFDHALKYYKTLGKEVSGR
jgi:hypothetical protein